MRFQYRLFAYLLWILIIINICLISKHSVNCLDSTNSSQTLSQKINEKDLTNILQTFNNRFITITNCYHNHLNANNCRCLIDETSIRRVSTIRSGTNGTQTAISFKRLSVVLLTHVFQSIVGFFGLVCKTTKKTIAKDLTKNCIDSYDNYSLELTKLFKLDKRFKESNVFEVIDPLVREIHEYYVTETTDQCFTTQDIVDEYVRDGEIHPLDHELHERDNNSNYVNIELISQLIVKRLIGGYCIKVTENDYWHYLLSRYGSGRNGRPDHIAHEGLQKLLRDLTIGKSDNLDDELSHNDNKEHIHHEDSQDSHRHKRSVPSDEIKTIESNNVCLNDNYYLKNFANNGYLSLDEIKNLCPILLQQIVSKVCIHDNDYHEDDSSHNHIHDHNHNHNHNHNHLQDLPRKEKSTSKMTTAELYGYSSLSVLIISLSAILGIFILPVLSKHSYNYVMNVFIGLAFGTLAGDALLHLIPQSLGLHSHEGEEHDQHSSNDTDPHSSPSHGIPDYFWYQLCLLGAIYGLFLFEVILNAIYSEDESEGKGGKGHGHGHSHSQKPDFNRNITPKPLSSAQANDSTIHLTSYCGSNTTLDVNCVDSTKSADSLALDKLNENEVIIEGKAVVWGLTPLALMITIGDGIHNFGDGLAIGVAFSSGFASGISTSLAVLFHEIPHELGDFAILLSTGLTLKRAAIINFASALTAFLGLYVGILLGANESSQQWIFSICGGIFLYVALTDMLPELKQNAKSSHPFLLLVLKNFGVLLGIGCMVIIAIFEDELHFD